MSAESDQQLLRAYAVRSDEAALRELVQRHTDFVYSAAIRQVASDAVARDLTQTVFTDLARRAAAILRKQTGESLAGWLHRATRYAALNHLRDSRRRRENERQAMEQLLIDSESATVWEQIRPALDEALDSLDDADREALLLRYFKNLDFRSVGTRLGVSDDTAQKRVSRAVERLREFFAKRGVTAGAGVLATIISANAVQAAPVGLAVTISAAALTGTAASSSAVIAATTKTIAMTTFQKTLVTVTVVALAGTGIYEMSQNAQLSDQVQTLQQQQAPLMEQVRQLQSTLAAATNRLAGLAAENTQLKSNPNQTELLKLRGEVTRLRMVSKQLAALQTNALSGASDSEYEAWIKRIPLLKQRVGQTAEANIPELRFLIEEDWMAAARQKLDSEADWQKAFSDVRSRAQSRFLNSYVSEALRRYLAANNNQFPGDVMVLKPYFDVPPSDEILQRYQVGPAAAEPLASPAEKAQGWIITPRVQEQGAFIALGPDGASGSADSPDMRVLAPAFQALLEATPAINGRKNADIHQLGMYLTTPEQKAAYTRLMSNSK